MTARFETTDKVALILALLLILGGFFAILAPQNLTFGRATNYPRNRQETLVEHISPKQSRLYGLGALLLGAGIATYVLWASRTT